MREASEHCFGVGFQRSGRKQGSHHHGGSDRAESCMHAQCICIRQGAEMGVRPERSRALTLGRVSTMLLFFPSASLAPSSRAQLPMLQQTKLKALHVSSL